LYTVALFRYRFLDIIPIARSRLIESMSTPMLVLDSGGRIIDLNPAACKLFSITPAVAVGKLVNGIASDWLDFLSLCQSGETSRSDLVRDLDGSTHFYEGSVELICTPSGEPEGRIVLLQDVTDRKRAEEKVVHLSSFPELTPVLILETDMYGSLLYANPAIRKAIEMMGESDPCIFIPQDIRDRLNGTVIGHSIQEENEIEIHGRVFRENVYFTHEFLSLRVYATDMTDRKRAEAQREILIHELSQKNAELDRFAYTVSHDLKSPLITIRGFLGLLEQDMAKNDTGQAQEDIKRISSGAEKMEHLITTLLELSRSGKRVDMPVRISVKELAHEAAGLLDISLKNRDVTLVIADNLPIVCGDRQRLLQVMMNLIENAVKFMGDQNKPKVVVGVRHEHNGPVFFVKDNGMGITKEDQSTIFTLFSRLNSDIPGTGIGLTTVKRVIEAHGCKLWVESEGLGKGTTFWFTLPEAHSVNEADFNELHGDTAYGAGAGNEK
jgi:PAS domain S-box-containing protein